MSVNSRKIISVLLFSFFLNPIIIKQFQMFCYALEYGLALVYICLNYSIVKSIFHFIRKVDLIVISCVLLSFVLSIIYPTIHNTYDYSYINVIAAIIRKLLILLFLYVYLIKWYGFKESYFLFLYYFSIATSLYVLSTLLFIAVPSLKDIWISIIGIIGVREDVMNSYGYVGRFGWAGFSGFRNTFDCCVSIIFLLYSRFTNISSTKISTRKYVALLFLNLLGTLFYGRIGIVVSLLCIFIALLAYKNVNYRIFGFSLGLAILLFGIIFVLKNHNQLLSEWYNWISVPLINYFETGSFNNYSANHLFNDMIFLPSTETLIFGDGRYTSPDGLYYMHTDSGFMRQLLFWGLFGTTVTYFATLISIINCSKNSKVISTLFLMVFIFFEIKGEIYYEVLPLCFLLGTMDKMFLNCNNEYSGTDYTYHPDKGKPAFRKFGNR